MMNTEWQKITIAIIQQNFNLEISDADKENFIRFRELLIDKLSFLLNYDFEKLLWILYRIDVDESMVKTTLASNPNFPPAEILADLIIERQMKKAETRIKYRRREF